MRAGRSGHGGDSDHDGGGEAGRERRWHYGRASSGETLARYGGASGARAPELGKKELLCSFLRLKTAVARRYARKIPNPARTRSSSALPFDVFLARALFS